MKNITNKTLGIIGIVLIILTFITSAQDSNGEYLFPLLSFIVFIAYIFFVAMSSSRLWKSSVYLVLGFIIFYVLSLVCEVLILVETNPQSTYIFYFLSYIIYLILTIWVIVKLFKKEETVNKEQNLNSKVEVVESSPSLGFKKETFWEKTKNLLGTGIGVVLLLVLAFGWILNLVKFFKLDFREPFKAEVIRGIGLAPTPIGSILGYISIKDK